MGDTPEKAIFIISPSANVRLPTLRIIGTDIAPLNSSLFFFGGKSFVSFLLTTHKFL